MPPSRAVATSSDGIDLTAPTARAPAAAGAGIVPDALLLAPRSSESVTANETLAAPLLRPAPCSCDGTEAATFMPRV